MHVAATARQILAELCHERSNQPMFMGDSFDRGLKEHRPVRCFYGLGIFNGSLVYPRACFRMQTLQRNVKAFQQIEEIAEVFASLRSTQN